MLRRNKIFYTETGFPATKKNGVTLLLSYFLWLWLMWFTVAIVFSAHTVTHIENVSLSDSDGLNLIHFVCPLQTLALSLGKPHYLLCMVMIGCNALATLTGGLTKRAWHLFGLAGWMIGGCLCKWQWVWYWQYRRRDADQLHRSTGI